MPKYLWKASYTTNGVKGIADAGGSSRRDAVQRATESAGGKVEAFYFAFGESDAYVFVDLPDNETAAALALAVNGTEGASVQTIVLMTPEELDAGTTKNVDFRPAAA